MLRTVTPTTSTLMHRQIEAMQIGELSLERRNLIAMKEMCEDSDEERGLEQSIAAKTKAIEELKTYVKKQDAKATVVKLDASNWLNQSWHDQRYYRAREAGIPHSVAWRKEKGRRRATLFRQRGVADRAQQRRELEEQWRAQHMSGKRKFTDYQEEDDGVNLDFQGVETEVIDETEKGLVVRTGGKDLNEKKYVRRPLTKEQLESYTQETKEDEKLVMSKKRVDLQHRPKRKTTAARREKKRSKRKAVRRSQMLCRNFAWVGKCERPGCPFRHDAAEKEEFLKVHCRWYLHGHCKRGDKCKFTHDENEKELLRIEKELAIMMKKEAQEKLDQEDDDDKPVEVIDLDEPDVLLLEKPTKPKAKAMPTTKAAAKKVLPLKSKAKPVKVTYQVRTVPKIGRQHDEKEVRDLSSLVEREQTCVTVNFDTGAAISTVPNDQFSKLAFGEPKSTCYRTASGELLEDRGQVKLYGVDGDYHQKVMNARVTDVHRILASGSEVCKKNVAFLDADGGYLIPEGGKAAHRIRKAVKRILEEETEEKPTTLRVEKGVYVFDFWVDEETSLKKQNEFSGNSRQA